MNEYTCKYCGGKAQKYQTICANCYVKLRLIRKLLKMVNDMKERRDNGRSEMD